MLVISSETSEESEGVSAVVGGASSGDEEVSGEVSCSGVAGSARWTPVIALGTLEVDLISMMVLLVKQVHLQKVGAACRWVSVSITVDRAVMYRGAFGRERERETYRPRLLGRRMRRVGGGGC